MKTSCIEAVPEKSINQPVAEPLAVLAARAACALEQSIRRLVLASDENLGHLERQAAADVQEVLRRSIERGAQAKADAALSGVRTSAEPSFARSCTHV